jgi:hypothetical protein
VRTLTFLHTADAHVATFGQLLAETAPGIPSRHIVAAELLAEARADGMTPQLEARIGAAVRGAAADGAAVVLCTCSTIGACAEQTVVPGVTVLRVDRPMAARAVALGQRIVLAAALASTLEPTRRLLRDEAARAGAEVVITDFLIADAWPHFEAGDHGRYLATIAAQLRQVQNADAIVLAQASMAAAAAQCADLPMPILSSPRLGLEAAISAYQSY